MPRPLLALLACLLWAAPLRAEAPVKLELVLAVDRSSSIDGATLDFQIDGHAAAFRHPLVIDAVAGGGPIAVTLVSWSDPYALATLVPWTVISGAEDAKLFAAQVEASPRDAPRGSTGLGAALVESARLFERNGIDAPRKVIDVVGNGANNIGIWPEHARGAVIAQGITVNGLAILDEEPLLGRYFERFVIGGQGAFVRVAANRESFTQALLEKLVLEIAGGEAPPSGAAGGRRFLAADERR